jgi:uncharacterized protein YmfQ (DUF2313 family)
MYNSTNYLRLLQSLLPKGKAWTRHEDSRLKQVLEGEAEEFARIDIRSVDLIRERDTRKTLELITEHEADFGLPDACGIEATTLTERRNILHTKLITLGQQDKQYFIDLAAALGYTITITEHQPFWAGVGCAGDPCGDQEVIFHWTVSTLLAAEIIYFMAGSGSAGDPLVKQPSLQLLECTINKYKPAHTTVAFVYTGYGFDRGFSSCFNAVPWNETPHLEGCFGRGFGIGFNVAYGGCFDKGFGNGFNKIG